MQHPSIGRVIHVNWSGQRIAAIVTYVWSATCVNARLQSGPCTEETSLIYCEEPMGDPMEKLNTMDTAHRQWSYPPRI